MNNSINSKEIEFKYDAKKIDLKKFITFCRGHTRVEYCFIRGKDNFYGNKNKKFDFYRHRIGVDMNQLTFKRKLNNKNNFIRIEHNIDLDMFVTEQTISSLCDSLGFKHNLTLLKSAFIFSTNKYTAVYYICYNEDHNEIGRFVELEMAEDFHWKNEKHAFDELKKLEKQFRPLGITSRGRIKDSLYEMFKN